MNKTQRLSKNLSGSGVTFAFFLIVTILYMRGVEVRKLNSDTTNTNFLTSYPESHDTKAFIGEE